MLFEIARSLRSVTRSPITAALNEAHKMARRHLETGGPASSARRPANHHSVTDDFVLPTDLDPVAVANVLRRKLGGGETNDPLYPLERKLGGRVVLRGRHILRLGDGRYDKGRAFLHALVKDLRARRWRMRFGTRR
jgi:hypothetical protein